MQVLRTIPEARAARALLAGRVALVPTMGALHAGHISLIELARRHADHVIVSIFVNPTQFGINEDYTRYPRALQADLAHCESAGVAFVFHPAVEEMYPPYNADISIDLPQLASMLEGKHRPGHFKGVCQVVAKLFNILTPTSACFGQKDFQQLRIITAMVESLNWPIEIIAAPTVRDPDGIAMSSRNQYLSPEERTRALAIPRALTTAAEQVKAGIRQSNRLMANMRSILLDVGPPGSTLGRVPVSVDYIAVVDPVTLKPVEVVEGPTVLAIAARVGTTRLIDNVIVGA